MRRNPETRNSPRNPLFPVNRLGYSRGVRVSGQALNKCPSRLPSHSDGFIARLGIPFVP